MKPALATLFVSTLLLPALSLAADDTRVCNLLGREIALRAAEELNTVIGAEQRTQLASIAAAVCLDYQAQADVQAVPSADGQGTAAARPAADADEEEAGRTFLNLKLIDPADRVQRPGLKRR